MMITKIGLELHFQLNTQTKVFSTSENSFNKNPNTTTVSYDWGYPGTLPKPNKKVVKLSLQGAYLLNCQIADRLIFDRKNYYYFDLPKGYQITQFFQPIGQNGYMPIFLPNQKWKKISILSASIEEDTAKTYYDNNDIFVDYNRSGIPLLEITTNPDFSNFQEVRIFLKKIIRLFRNANISKADLSKGSLRIDLNISNSFDGINFCDRTEIKNLNSIRNIDKSIQEEIIYQKNHFNKIKNPCTKNYDEKKQKLVFLRDKFDQMDYFFLPENNIAPIFFSKSLLKNSVSEIKKWVNYEDNFIKQKQLSFLNSEFLFNNPQLIPFFSKLEEDKKILRKNIFLFFREVLKSHLLNYPNASFAHFKFSIVKKLLFLFQTKKINFNNLKTLFIQFLNDKNFNLTKALRPSQNNDDLRLKTKQFYDFLDLFCKTDSQILIKYKTQPTKTINYLMGQIPLEFKSLFKPKVIIEMIQNHLKKSNS